MPVKHPWTDQEIATALELRANGAAWDEVERKLHLRGRTIREHLRAIGLEPPSTKKVKEFHKPPPPLDPNAYDHRQPMPAGHPISWNAMNAGTVLEGEKYPWA